MTIKPFYFYLIICICVFSCNVKNEKPIDFKDVFKELNSGVIISESDSISLEAIGIPYITSNKILLPSYASNKIYIFSYNDLKHTNIINNKDELNLRMPYSVSKIDNKYYINDRGNHQIKIVDSSFKLINHINIQGQVDNIKKLKNKYLVIQGVHKVAGGNNKLFRVVDTALRKDISFGNIPETTKYYTWKFSIDQSGKIYIINVIGNRIKVYSEKGEEVKEIRLKSLNLDRVLQEEEIKDLNPMEILEYTKERDYLTIDNMYLYNNAILIQYASSLNKLKDKKFTLDVFDLEGKFIYSVDMQNKRIIDIENNKLKISKDTIVSNTFSIYIDDYYLIKNIK